MYVLGISCFYHDAAAALIHDGKLVCASQEERFSRIKHDFNFPQKAIEFCLREAKITIDDVDLVVFYEKPFQKFDRILLSALATWPRSAVAFREAAIVWLLDKLWARDIIQERLGCQRDKIAFCRHHVAHACSAYYPSGFDSAALLTVDGVGEWSCGSRGAAWDFTVDVCEEMRYPHSLGLLYSAFTAFLGFQVNEGEYKVMGMAPYGKPEYADTILEKIVDLHDDGSFKLNMEYFAYHRSAFHSFSPAFTALFGKPRTKEESNLLDPHYANIAASIQRVTEIILVRQATYLRKKYGHENLCMAGGSALNSVANAKIFTEAGFKRIFIQPAAGDDGGALGAALWGYYNVLGGRERFKMTHCYWGEQHSDQEVKDFLNSRQREFVEYTNDADLFKDVVARLTHGQVVGWMQGRFEWGPRALGDRSILADPRFSQMKDVVNARIKFREPFRPFAPSVLADRVEDFFDLPDAENVDPARFMLMVVPVKKERQKDVPAITHVDGTARIQAVHRQDNPRYYDLIKAFSDETGVPVVLNTSFNLRGEAIVNTPEEAYSTFERSDMDALVMGNIVVSRREIDDQRQLSKSELEKWSHTPTSQTSEQALPAQSSEPVLEVAKQAAENHRRYLARMAKEQADSNLGPIGYICQALLMLLMVALVLEVIVRFCCPIPNMQMRGIYCLGEKDEVEISPNWSGRIHTSEFDVRLHTDANGHRVPDPAKKDNTDTAPASGAANSRELLACGDSFTFGCWDDTDTMWLSEVQRQTPYRVTNVGRPNAGTETELSILKKETAQHHYDLALLGFYTGNDLYENMLGDASFTVQNGGLVLTPEAESKWSDYNCLSTSNTPKKVGWRPRWLRRLYLYQMAMARLSFDSSILRPSETPAWLLRQYTPDMEATIGKTYNYLRQIKEYCEQQRTALAVVVIPSAIELYPEDLQSWTSQRSLDPGLFDQDKVHQIIVRWCEEQQVPYIDLYPVLRNMRRTYYLKDMHWNHSGHLAAGLAVSQFLGEAQLALDKDLKGVN
ncbi:hypothetical protein IJT17_07725 [bacterium]|nr:hypothetical protein [bacterium]